MIVLSDRTAACSAFGYHNGQWSKSENTLYATKNAMLSGRRDVETRKSRLKYVIKYDMY